MNKYLVVERMLTELERAAFLANLAERLPRLRGAHVSDALQILDDSDWMLPVTETYCEQTGSPDARLAVYVYRFVVGQDRLPPARGREFGALMTRIKKVLGA